MYKDQPNDPSIPQEQRNFTARREERAPPNPWLSVQNPAVNLQLYPEQKPRQRQQQSRMDAFQMMQNVNPLLYQYYLSMLPPPVIHKEYNLSISGPTGDHVRAGSIYEDELPDINISGLTLNDRLVFIQYIRTLLFPNGDGADARLEGLGENSLLNHLKFLVLNPYNRNRFSQNPYKGLPNGFLIYRSCYPIRHNPNGGNIACAKNSMGMNVRLYKMVEGAYMLRSHNITNANDYDELRELGFYEFIREKVLKNKVCPNFVMMYGYYIVLESGIEYDKINMTKNSQTQPCVPISTLIYGPVATIDLTAYTGKSLVILTESPTYNIMDWASVVYERDGPVKRMINTGFHAEDIWLSVIFQIMVALYVMQIKKIYINNMTLDKNIFIKELTSHSNITGHWKYVLNGVEYYLPNHGFLVMIDSNYSDLEDGRVPPVYRTGIKFKVEGEIFGDISSPQLEMFKNFQAILDPDNFKGDFVRTGGVAPSPAVMAILQKIKEIPSDSTKDVSVYIHKYMTRFLNNRVGTYLRESEVRNILRNVADFKRGDMVIYNPSSDMYKFALYLQAGDVGRSEILFRNEPTGEITSMLVNTPQLLKYSNAEPIEQDYKANSSIFNDLLETYIVGN